MRLPSSSASCRTCLALETLNHDEDFALVLEVSYYSSYLICTTSIKNIWQGLLGAWQAKCWDPKVGNTAFDDFCDALSKPFGGVTAANMELPFGHPKRVISLGQGVSLDLTIISYGRWIKEVSLSVVPTFTAKTGLMLCYSMLFRAVLLGHPLKR